jgi:hypothetical protein
MIWLCSALTSVGTSIITCALMEMYFQRRATDPIHDYDLPGDHRSGS